MHWSGGVTLAPWLIPATSVAIVISWPVTCPPWTLLRLDAAPPQTSRALLVQLLGSGIINAHAGSVAQSTQNLVAAGDDLVALLQPLQHLNFGGAANARFHRHKRRAAVADYEHTLNFLLVVAAAVEGQRSRLHRALAGIFPQLGSLAHGQRLDGDGQRVLPRGGCHLGRGGEPR